MTTRPLPEHLHHAYNWTQAAGELDTLTHLRGDDLTAYCNASEENALEQDDATVTARDLHTLHEWLVKAGACP
jgi:hypothetical protein